MLEKYDVCFSNVWKKQKRRQAFFARTPFEMNYSAMVRKNA